MTNKVKITAVAGVAICSMVSVANASEIKNAGLVPQTNFSVLDAQQAAHPYQSQLDESAITTLSIYSPIVGEVSSSPKRTKHFTPEKRSLAEKIMDFFFGTGSDSRL